VCFSLFETQRSTLDQLMPRLPNTHLATCTHVHTGNSPNPILYASPDISSPPASASIRHGPSAAKAPSGYGSSLSLAARLFVSRPVVMPQNNNISLISQENSPALLFNCGLAGEICYLCDIFVFKPCSNELGSWEI